MPLSQYNRNLPPFFMCLAYALLVGCVTAPVRETTIHESQRGWVYLAKATDSGFRASHPLSLDHALTARILQGIRVQPRQGKPTTLMFGPAARAKAFSDEEAEFLAPFIATALGGATARQVVAFGVIAPLPPGPLSTAGVLYVQGPSLYLTLTRYRSGSEPAARADFPDFTRLYQLEIQFTPESVLSTDRPPRPSPPGLGELATLAIDYRRLAALPEPKPDHSSAVSPSQSSASAKPRGTDQREAEVEQLREENRSLKRRLAEVESEVSRLKKDRRDRRDGR
ncbi:MAG: bZIP transcription factor [Nitrospira sp.]|nr:bZIP transcription factor [Nitrospira sp.]